MLMGRMKRVYFGVRVRVLPVDEMSLAIISMTNRTNVKCSQTVAGDVRTTKMKC